MKAKGVSISKFEDGVLNEDAVRASNELIAVSDGAGGGGVFAEKWSQYLVDNLPPSPIRSFEELDSWIDNIWEQFYNDCEAKAKEQQDGLFLKKFYDEGSFATLAALWSCDDEMRWMTYGDSVVFMYNQKTEKLSFTFPHLSDFAKPPFLINCKDPLAPEGIATGSFPVDKDCIYFVASDTLSHYIMMMYMVAHRDDFKHELEDAIEGHNKNSNLVKKALASKQTNFKKVITKLVNCANHPGNFKKHIESLIRQGLIAHDDYSLAVMFGK